jgi:hypothetical protein
MNQNLSMKPPPKSWAISLRCRSKGLDFRMNVANILPNWGNGGEKISLFLRLKRFFLLTVESEFGDPTRNLDFKKTGRVRRFWGSIRKLFGRWRKGKRRRLNLVKGNECWYQVCHLWQNLYYIIFSHFVTFYVLSLNWSSERTH